VRPLLALERTAIDAYIAAHALPVWDDPMNLDPAFARVRMRREILPLLRRENPQLDAALVRLAESAAEWLAVIDRAAAPFAQFPIACSALAKEPPAIRKRALALALEHRGYAAVHLEQIDRAVTAPPHGTIRIAIAGAVLVKSYDTLDLERDHAPATLAAPDGYLLRTWQPGDRMRLARLKGRSRKLSDLYIDAKVPQPIRATARVLVRISDATIVWAEHLGVAFEESVGPGASPEE
jgi:tRNA(Ile)-lysidine synthase